MANMGICIPLRVASTNVDSWNRTAKTFDSPTVDIQNGSAVELVGQSTVSGEGEVWKAYAPTTSHLSNLWMVWSPEIVLTTSGTYQFQNIDPDPRNFLNLKTRVFDCFKPQLGDIIRLSEDALAGSTSTGNYVVATNTVLKLTWAAAAVSGLSLLKLATSFISIGTGVINQRVTSYDFEVVATA